MKYILLFGLSLLMSANTIAQSKILKPVEWSFEVSSTPEGVYTFTATADIDEGWVIYSQHTGEGGPIPLSFTYDSDVNRGETKELSDAIKGMDKLFETEVVKFKGKAIFTQEFVPKRGQKIYSGYLTYMCCDNLRCLPPTDVDFEVAL